MFYEVFIPAKPNEDGFDTTITVEADNWMAALKSGLERTGQGSDIRNVMCDIKDDNSIHVTDATTRRVFVLKEVEQTADEDEKTERIDLNTVADKLNQSKIPTQPLSPPKSLSLDPASSFAADKETEPQFDGDLDAPNAFTDNVPKTEPQFQTQPTEPVKTTPAPKPAEQAPPKQAPVEEAPPKNAFTENVPTTEPQFRAPPEQKKPATIPPQQQAPPPKHSPPPQAQTQAQTPPQTLAEKSSPPPQAQTPPVQRTPEQNKPPVQPVVEQKPATPPPSNQDVDVFRTEEGGGLSESSWTSKDGRISIGSATYEALKRDENQPKVVRETRSPSGTRPAVDVSRLDEESSVSQNILEEVFLEIQRIHEGMEMEEVIAFSMDLSMEKIDSEAGSIMFADLTGTEMYFATARGPKAKQVMDFRIPMGVGLVGFCVREGVSLAISDVENDPRFYKDISEALGYPTKNLCCAPIQHEGRVYGAIELLNKSRAFLPNEVSALTYIANQLAKYIHDLIMEKEKL